MKNTWMKKIAALFLLMCFALPSAYAEFKQEQDYKKVEQQATATGDKIEVLEFFWYGCPHCYQFEPHINKWKASKPDNVEFIRVPTVFHPSWKVQARTYYALEAMGIIEDKHKNIFAAIHNDKVRLDTLEKTADFLAKHGVNKDEFVKNYRSFSIDGKVRKANKLVKNYKVSGVPSIAVNGKYLVDGKMAKNYDRMLDIINHLVDKESK